MLKKILKILICILPIALILSTFGLFSSTVYATNITGTDANGFQWSYNGTSVTITGYSGSGGSITIPATEVVNGVSVPVSTIGSLAFYDCTSISNVTIPSGLTSIGSQAFFYCSITTVNIPSTVTSIGSQVFYRCTSLSTVNLSSGLTQIGSDAFGYCFALKSIDLPNTLTTIGSCAFECSGLQSITIPNSVTSIGTEAFYQTNLKTVTVQAGVTNIGNYTFYGCSSLTSVSLPVSLTSIQPYTFYGCSKLTSITVPSNVSYIGSQAFYGCSTLTSVSVFNNATSYGGSVFTGTPSSLKLYGFSASTTNTYATNNSIQFVPFVVSSISMKSGPTKVQYIVGDTLNLAGAAITVLYNSGSTQDIAVTSNMCDITTLTASGQQQVNVTLSGQSTHFNVTVTNPATGITQLPDSLTIVAGSPQAMNASVIPSGADNPAITWSSSNSAVATVDSSGHVTGICAGAVVITATTVDGGYTTSCNVTVQYVNVTGVLLVPMNSTLHVGHTQNLTATVYPKNASDKNITWSSNEQSVASVDNHGTVTANAPGSATITITSEDGSKTAVSHITVITPVSSIGISGTNAIVVGQSVTLSATIHPADATNQQAEWRSNNPSIVSVNQSGLIHGISAGTTTICAKAKDNSGISSTYTITVSAPAVSTPTPSPINMNGYSNLLAAATDAKQTAQALVSSKQSQLANLRDTLASSQQDTMTNIVELVNEQTNILELQAQADEMQAIILATSTIPGAGDVSIEEAEIFSGIYAEMGTEEAIVVGLNDSISGGIDAAVAAEEQIEAAETVLAQAECDEAAAETVVEAEDVLVDSTQVAEKSTEWYDLSEYYDDTVQDIRTSTGLTSSSRNMAYTETEINGPKSVYKAYSSTSDIDGFVNLETDASKRLFDTSEIGNYDRYVDTEAKTLEKIAKDLGAYKNADGTVCWGNINASGTINLYTELEPCPSCDSVISQFKQHYPNIIVNVFWTTDY